MTVPKNLFLELLGNGMFSTAKNPLKTSALVEGFGSQVVADISCVAGNR